MTASPLIEAIQQLPEGDRLALIEVLIDTLIRHDPGKRESHFQRYVLLRDPDCLAGLSPAELTTLAHSQLTSDRQAELRDLLSRNCQDMNGLSSDEQTRLDEILAEIDQLNLLKAKALYTLQRLQALEVA